MSAHTPREPSHLRSALQPREPRRPRRIAHFDLDSFFVAVERALDPSLIGKPVLVGHAGARGVVASASYEARKFGCHSAQPMAQALRLCPQAVVVMSGHDVYGKYSRQFHDILNQTSPVVESVGVDEAYVDLTGTGPEVGGAYAAAQDVRRRVREELGLVVSACIAGSRTVAKVGSDRAKPDGLLEVPVGQDAAFLAPLPIRDLPLVGPRLGEALQAVGVRTIGDAADLDARWLAAQFGKAGEALAQHARGIDHTPVRAGGREHRQISRENTFGQDVTEVEELRRVLQQHADRVGGDLRRQGRRARTVSIKVRWSDFTTLSRSRTLDRPVQATAAIVETARDLLDEVVRTEGLRPVRLLGVAVSNLVEDQVQLSLDDLGSGVAGATAADGSARPRVLRDEELDRAIDGLRARFGDRSVTRGL
ncbi:MAG: DNA polymerase IV [Dehalococcoidia bacterium]|nr:DNA polymerase IV [Dehalococcoidia bacterium]